MAVVDVMRGRKPQPPMPVAAREFLLLKEFPGWTLHYIRSLSSRDYNMLVALANAVNSVEAQEQERAMKRAQSKSNQIRR